MPNTPNVVNPMTPKQYTNIVKGLAEINEAIQIGDIIEECGADCAEEKLQIQQTREFLEALKARFYPTKP